jgi:hypothetical protein
MAKDRETDEGKESILPQNPKKPFLDCNCRVRTISQIPTGHWLSAFVMFTSLFGSWNVRLVVFEPGG